MNYCICNIQNIYIVIYNYSVIMMLRQFTKESDVVRHQILLCYWSTGSRLPRPQLLFMNMPWLCILLASSGKVCK